MTDQFKDVPKFNRRGKIVWNVEMLWKKLNCSIIYYYLKQFMLLTRFVFEYYVESWTSMNRLQGQLYLNVTWLSINCE